MCEVFYEGNSLRYQSEYDLPLQQSEFQQKVKDIDEQYTDASSVVITDVTTNLKTSIVSKNPFVNLNCMAKFANCFIELDKSVIDGNILCPEPNPSIDEPFERNVKTNRLTFIFFVQVELLLAPNCIGTSNTCALKKDDDKKILIRYIQKTFLVGEEKIPFLSTPTCIDQLKRVRDGTFLESELPKQIEALEKIRDSCIGQIQTDYASIMTSFPRLKSECLNDIVKTWCYPGKLQLDIDVIDMIDNTFNVKLIHDNITMYIIRFFAGTEKIDSLQFFLRASLACNLAEGEKAPGAEFYLQFPNKIETYKQSFEQEQKNVKDLIYEYVTSKLGNCTGIIDYFEDNYPDCYYLVLWSITGGIYKCETKEKCTFDTIDNKHLIIDNVKETLEKVLQTPIGTKLKETCSQDNIECQSALEEIKLDGFTSKGFNDQKSALDVIVLALVKEVQTTYTNLETPECEGQMQEKCLGISNIILFVFFNYFIQNFSSNVLYNFYLLTLRTVFTLPFFCAIAFISEYFIFTLSTILTRVWMAFIFIYLKEQKI